MTSPCGQADFYPNGGFEQTGCVDIFTCPHIRSYEYFAESINNDRFKAEKCASFFELLSGFCSNQGGDYRMGGEPPNYENKGTFFLRTAGSPPYALG